MPGITTHLFFDNEAKEAAAFQASLFMPVHQPVRRAATPVASAAVAPARARCCRFVRTACSRGSIHNCMKACAEHRHEHRQLPCPYPDCPNSEGAADVTEVPRHTGAGQMTQAEGHFEVAPPPRVFNRTQWKCEQCGASGWTWVEAGAKARSDRCPHRRPPTVAPRAR